MVDNIRTNRCLLCGDRGRDRSLCPGCLADLPWLNAGCASCALPLPEHDEPGTAERQCSQCLQAPPAWQAAAVFRYEFPVDALIAAFKYQHRLALADSLGELLADRLPPHWRDSVLLAVPVHDRRLRERGYNQAHLLARVVARHHGLRWLPEALRRQRDTAMQKSLSPAARQDNLDNAFVWQGPPLAGCNVLVIDDVLTTGATLNALGRVLKAAGAGEVRALVVARTLPP